LELEEGDELLRSVQTHADSILPTLTASAQSHNRCDVQSLVTSLADLKSQLDTTLIESERCRAVWSQYDAERDAFSSWIASQLQQLETEPQKQTSLEDKKTALDTQQVRCRRRKWVIGHFESKTWCYIITC